MARENQHGRTKKLSESDRSPANAAPSGSRAQQASKRDIAQPRPDPAEPQVDEALAAQHSSEALDALAVLLGPELEELLRKLTQP